MGQKCTVCSHEKRKDIEKLIVSGQSNRNIGKRYNLGHVSVRNHKMHHLSRQLLKNEETRNLLHGRNLLENIQTLISKTENILDDVENKKLPFVKLSAIRELRMTYEFLLKFSAYMWEAQKQDHQKELDKQIGDIKRLDVYEIRLLGNLIDKMNGKSGIDVLADIKNDMLMKARMHRFDDNHASMKQIDFEDDEEWEEGEEVPVKETVYRRKGKGSGYSAKNAPAKRFNGGYS